MTHKNKGLAGQSEPNQNQFAGPILDEAVGGEQGGAVVAADFGGPSLSERARQCHRLREALCRGPVSTLQARTELGIMHVAGRVRELRNSGHSIKTAMVEVLDADGRPHRSGVYSLEAEHG